MGFNTTVTLLNDRCDLWPAEIANAMNRWAPPWATSMRLDSDGRFGYGHVVAVDHADGVQVCITHQNMGTLAHPFPGSLQRPF